ncbi:lipocalin family protein [Idiomarina aminovorans]|uniref:lipocalin family protein n=1 Tax=Idiomarina aminovorans TaxID=2914829 RepID=UPI002003CBE6|nr:lipocalin family protein [Idiomarina sp. ATCH4]MCK7459358.1 lipocalin family protein [Idiomarina sp. ATCH4]
MNKWILSLLFTFLLSACNSQPTPVAGVVEDFDAERYLGKWYEIARMPHSFEEGLQSVTAEYRLNGDGTLEVTNRGYHTKDEEWQTAIGLAEPVENMKAAYQVTFFWPFYGGYYVSWLDDNYQLAIVTSDSHEYFWLLSRTPDVAQEDIDYALAKAHQWGYNIDQMIRVDHPAELRSAN